MDGELEHPLPELRERLSRAEVEVADEVDEQEGECEREHDGATPLRARRPERLAQGQRLPPPRPEPLHLLAEPFRREHLEHDHRG